MKNSLGFLALGSVLLLVKPNVSAEDETTTSSKSSHLSSSVTTSHSVTLPSVLAGTNLVASGRVKRGYYGQGRSHSTGIAYNRINDAGQLRTVGDRGHGGDHGHKDEEDKLSPVGEDGTHTTDFKSYGVGFEHRHGGHCEESKCGYNIRHCPHGCVFNSFLCGGGRAYDTCCC